VVGGQLKDSLRLLAKAIVTAVGERGMQISNRFWTIIAYNRPK